MQCRIWNWANGRRTLRQYVKADTEIKNKNVNINEENEENIWMTEYVYNIVMLAKKEPKKKGDEQEKA